MMTPGSDELLKRFLDRGYEFDFFQLVWLIEQLRNDDKPVGGRGPVSEEPIRFRPAVSMGFAPTDVRHVTEYVDPSSDRSTYILDVAFMGLYGVSTPMPLHYAIDVLRSVDPYDPAAEDSDGARSQSTTKKDELVESAPTRDFLDVFHHRIISLFYRAWLKYRFDKAFPVTGRNDVTDYMFWFIGCPSHYDRETLGVDPIRLLRYGGILTQHPRSGITLEGMLDDYWDGLDVEVEQFVGRWVPLASVDMNVSGQLNCTLGDDLIIGDQMYDLSSTFNVVIGPMDWTTYVAFLPDGQQFAETVSLIRLYSADPLAFTIQATLLDDQVPETKLTSGDDAGRLGYTTWLRTDEVGSASVTFDSLSPLPLPEGEKAFEVFGVSPGVS